MVKVQLPGKAPSEEKKNPASKTQKPLEPGLQAESPSLHQTVNNIHQSTPQGMQMLQRTVGNRVVQGLMGNKEHAINSSTVIQRHVSSMDTQLATVADGILSSSAEEVGHGYGGVLSAQQLLQGYRQSAESYSAPLPGSNELGGPSSSDSADQGEEIVM